MATDDVLISGTTHFGGSPEGECGCCSRVLWDERWWVRSGRLPFVTYFSYFSYFFVVVFFFCIVFIQRVYKDNLIVFLYCIVYYLCVV